MTTTTQTDPKLLDELTRFVLSNYDTTEIESLFTTGSSTWPAHYVNAETKKTYAPHHLAEHRFVSDDFPRYGLAKGGEGGGKSVAGIIKTLERVRRGMSGIMVSPDLPHFRRSLWPEFRRWCPWDQVVPEQQYRSRHAWDPKMPFILAFENQALLFCGGIDDPGAWRGPNVSFAFFDEAWRKRDPEALKVLDGRVRLQGPDGESPQLFITTTPRKHWLYSYFGPLRAICADCGTQFEAPVGLELIPVCPDCRSTNYTSDDPRLGFKLHARVVTLLTVDNEANLEPGYAERRALSLTAAERRVLLEAAWEDIEAGENYLPSMLLWDLCREELPPLRPREPLVLSIDAATGRESGYSDCFGLIGLTRHPDRSRHRDCVAVRFVHVWQARPGERLDFQGSPDNPGPELLLRRLCADYTVAVCAYDPAQLHDMATRLMRDRVVWMFEFGQVERRVRADTDLLHLIVQRRLAHDGNPLLREHFANADRKLDRDGKRLRIVRREDALKIDLAVCTSMASYEALRLNLR